MNENTYRKVEGMIYGYYRKKTRIKNLSSKLLRIQKRIDRLGKDLRECNLELGETLKAIDYSSDVIKSNTVKSNIEKALDNAIAKILKEIEYNIRSKYKIKSKIINLDKSIENIEVLLSKLTEEEIQIIEARYGDQKNYREMEYIFHMSKSTLQRKKDRIILYLVNDMGQNWDTCGKKLS